MAKKINHETIINKTSTFCQFAHLIAPKGYLLEAKMQASNSKDATIKQPNHTCLAMAWKITLLDTACC